MVDGIPAPSVLVGHPFSQTVDVTTATLKRQVAQHVVERSILHHQDDDMVDLLKIGRTGFLHHATPQVRVLSYCVEASVSSTIPPAAAAPSAVRPQRRPPGVHPYGWPYPREGQHTIATIARRHITT